MSITIHDVAKKAGVSSCAVSRIMNGKDASIRISSDTRNRVLRIAKDMHYHANSMARGLRSGRSSLIGVLSGSIETSFLGQIIQGVEEVAAEHDYGVLLSTAAVGARQILECLDLFLDKRVDGILINPLHYLLEMRESLNKVIEKVPVVSVTGVVEGRDIPSVMVDGVAIGYLATRHLIARGCTRIWHLAAFSMRRVGYRKALEEAGLPYLKKRVIALGCEWKDGYEGTRRILQRDSHPEAIFASTDILALGAMRALKEAGLKAGEDVAVVGADDLDLAAQIETPLTTIRQPKKEQGTIGAEILFGMLAGKKVKSVVLQPTLVIRESCGARRGR